MTQQQTAARSPRPKAAPSSSATLPAGPTTEAATIFAEQSNQDTLMARGQHDATRTLAPGATRGATTVLPDVRSEGEQLVIVPRDQARYESDKLLGRGGMGEVKLAQDHDIGRKVAVKRLLDERNPHAVARFIDEVRTVGSLEHPNIVPIHDVGVDEDGALFFVMKYVEGETLAAIIARLAKGDPEAHRTYTVEHRLDLFAGLVRALQYAHSRGLVHRDIKPENVMVGPYGEVILMDWGIAHPMRSDERGGTPTQIERSAAETVDGAVVGTPQYMSPEQAAGEVAELDGRSDLYSAFVLLWELLTLTPFVEVGKTAMQTIVNLQERPPASVFDRAFEDPHPHQAAVPIELRYFLVRGLQRDKDQRFPSGAEVLFELDRVRAGEFAVHCPITFMKRNTTRAGRFMDHRPVASMWLATLSALAFLGGVAGWVAWALG